MSGTHAPEPRIWFLRGRRRPYEFLAWRVGGFIVSGALLFAAARMALNMLRLGEAPNYLALVLAGLPMLFFVADIALCATVFKVEKPKQWVTSLMQCPTCGKRMEFESRGEQEGEE